MVNCMDKFGVSVYITNYPISQGILPFKVSDEGGLCEDMSDARVGNIICE